jgi:hypothetical protein
MTASKEEFRRLDVPDLALKDLRARKLISDEEFFNRQGEIITEIT